MIIHTDVSSSRHCHRGKILCQLFLHVSCVHCSPAQTAFIATATATHIQHAVCLTTMQNGNNYVKDGHSQPGCHGAVQHTYLLQHELQFQNLHQTPACSICTLLTQHRPHSSWRWQRKQQRGRASWMVGKTGHGPGWLCHSDASVVSSQQRYADRKFWLPSVNGVRP